MYKSSRKKNPPLLGPEKCSLCFETGSLYVALDSQDLLGRQGCPQTCGGPPASVS